MRLLFIENRYVTWLWREVAVRLLGDGHEIHWLVQNPVFSPSIGIRHRLPFPPRASPQRTAAGVASDRLRSDRAIRHFGADAHHHAHYRMEIGRLLDDIRPNLIFGEPTQFHELITIDLAKARGIPYFFPSSTRYPSGRLAFHRDDTMDTFGGCGTPMPDAEALALREAIVERRSAPSYMQPSRQGALARRLLRWGDRLRISAGWLAGERLITPAPWRKLALERRHRGDVARWEAIAARAPKRADWGDAWALYAMQMQPESNLDVWGQPWNDQVAIIREAADALGAVGAKLVVKPNPKSKYELDAALCDLADRHPHVVALSHSSVMRDVFAPATAVLSVTGTVIIESVLACKPVGVLGGHAMSRLPGVTRLARPADIADLVIAARDGCASKASVIDGSGLLAALHRDSYDAAMFDPLNQPEMATAENLQRIATAFRALIALVGAAQPAGPAA